MQVGVHHKQLFLQDLSLVQEVAWLFFLPQANPEHVTRKKRGVSLVRSAVEYLALLLL